jgi:hypothetical protein
MNVKVLSTSLAIAVSCMLGSYSQAATTESTRTTTEESKTVDVPKRDSKVVEEKTTTETKRGVLGKSKETTTSTRTEREGDGTTSGEVKSRTTVETERNR